MPRTLKCSVESLSDLNGRADFYASELEGLKREGKFSLDTFLSVCKEKGFSIRKKEGNYSLQLSPELYQQVTVAAKSQGVSINRFLEENLKRAQIWPDVWRKHAINKVRTEVNSSVDNICKIMGEEMNIEPFITIQKSIKKHKGRSLNEAMTKNALILPFIQALGYDIFNPSEVAAEYTADFGTKRGERIDYAILIKGKPVIIIECKPLGTNLDKGRCSQLFRYFATLPSAKIGILTDGCHYLFFTDLENKNLMDSEPFLELNLEEETDASLMRLELIAKEATDIDAFIKSSTKINEYSVILQAITEDLKTPSTDFIFFYASLCHNGKMTQKMLDHFTPIVQKALKESLATIPKSSRSSTSKTASEIKTSARLESENSDDIITENTELWALVAIKTMLKDIMDHTRICIRDKKSYCGILLDDNNRKPICRLFNFKHFKFGNENIGDNAYILIFSTPEGKKFPLRFIDDLYPLQSELIKAVRRYL